MMAQQHKDHMEMGTQLNEIRKGMEILGDERKEPKVNDISGTYRWFRGKFILTILILWGFLATGSLLYGQGTNDALNIDKNGNVGIGTNAPKAKLDVAGTVTANKFVTTNGINLLIPIGTIMAYGGDTTNADIKKQLKEIGWLPCNGDEVPLNEYRDLYNVIHASFGSRKDYFNLPDLRGRFLRGVDQGQKRDLDANSRIAPAKYGNVGDNVGSVQDDAIGQHKHEYQTNIWYWEEGTTGGRFVRGDHTTDSLHYDATGKTVPPGGNETRPKNIYVNWIIKAK